MSDFELTIVGKLEAILEQLKFLNGENSRREREAESKIKEMGEKMGTGMGDALKEALSGVLGDGK